MIEQNNDMLKLLQYLPYDLNFLHCRMDNEPEPIYILKGCTTVNEDEHGHTNKVDIDFQLQCQDTDKSMTWSSHSSPHNGDYYKPLLHKISPLLIDLETISAKTLNGLIKKHMDVFGLIEKKIAIDHATVVEI